MRLFNNQRQSLEVLSSELGDVREKVLTEDEKTVINMVIDGKSDKQISQVLQVTVSAINQKRTAIYKLILGLNWWKQNRDTILQTLDKELGGVAAVMFEMVATRRKQNEIAKHMGMSIWKVNKSMGIILEVLGRNPEFRTYMENMHLGYHLSWRVKKEKKAGPTVQTNWPSGGGYAPHGVPVPNPTLGPVDATPTQAPDPVTPVPEAVQSQVTPVQETVPSQVDAQTPETPTVEEGAKTDEHKDSPPVL